MKNVLIAIPKENNEWKEGFVLSLCQLFMYEHLNMKYQLRMATVTGKPVEEAREQLVQEALANNYDYLFFLDDDMVFPPNALRRLLSHGVPFASGLGFLKQYPFTPTALQATTTRKGGIIHESYAPFMSYPTDPFAVDGIGLFCSVIEVEAIKKLQTPYFSSPHLAKDSVIGEDISFCRRFFEAGLPILCDPNVQTGHIRDDGKVITQIDFKKGLERVHKA